MKALPREAAQIIPGYGLSPTEGTQPPLMWGPLVSPAMVTLGAGPAVSPWNSPGQRPAHWL